MAEGVNSELDRTVCRCLSARNSYGVREGGGDPWLLVDPTTMVFRCSQTLQTVGPDGYLASLRGCHAGRRCYRAPRPETEV